MSVVVAMLLRAVAVAAWNVGPVYPGTTRARAIVALNRAAREVES